MSARRFLRERVGASLIEVMVAIVILALLVAPITSSIVLAYRLNARADAALQANLTASSAAEILIADGFDPDCLDPDGNYTKPDYQTIFDQAKISASESRADTDELVGYELTITVDEVTLNVWVPPAGS